MKLSKRIAAKIAAAAFASGAAFGLASVASAEVNVAFFLEWATPNQEDKVKKTYDDALGERVNWTNFDAGTQMTEAMLAGDIDISYSQGMTPFLTGVKADAPIKMVGIAVVYTANSCFVRNDAGIDKSNASELEGQSVAVPLNTMADYSFRRQMDALGVDVDKVKVIDQVPADGATSLVDGSVVMACIFGGNSAKKARSVGSPLMTAKETAEAGIFSFDVVSVTEKFAQEHPEKLRTFLEVTDEANARFNAGKSDMSIIAKDAGMTVDGAWELIRGDNFTFPSNKEQLRRYFNRGGPVRAALGKHSKAIDTSFLK